MPSQTAAAAEDGAGNRRFVLQDAGACVTAGAVDAGACVVDGGRAGAFRSLVSSLVGGGGEKSLRCLPSFLIVGAQKAATGSLSDWLSRHPMLRRGSGPKAHAREVHYFDRLRGNATASVDGTWREYLGAFPRLSPGRDKGWPTSNRSSLGRFRLSVRRAIISRSGLEREHFSLERARARNTQS